jgi:hypothetical protein
MSPDEPKYLNRPAASEYLQSRYGLRCSKQTLAKYATVGGGPEYIPAGSRQILYTQQALDNWAAARMGKPRRSTSEPATIIAA